MIELKKGIYCTDIGNEEQYNAVYDKFISLGAVDCNSKDYKGFYVKYGSICWDDENDIFHAEVPERYSAVDTQVSVKDIIPEFFEGKSTEDSPKEESVEYDLEGVYIGVVAGWGLPDGTVMECVENNTWYFKIGEEVVINSNKAEAIKESPILDPSITERLDKYDIQTFYFKGDYTLDWDERTYKVTSKEQLEKFITFVDGLQEMACD